MNLALVTGSKPTTTNGTGRFPVVITLLGFACIIFTSCSPSHTTTLLEPSKVLGTVLAEEVAHLAGANKRVAVITPDASWGATSIAEESFRAALNKQGFQITTAKSVNVGNPMRRGQIGLKADDFFEALEKSSDAGAIVSFAGPPLINNADSSLKTKHPPVVVVATASLGNVAGVWSDPVQFAGLLDSDIINLAVIDSPGGGPQTGKPDATHALFAEHFRVLRRND